MKNTDIDSVNMVIDLINAKTRVLNKIIRLLICLKCFRTKSTSACLNYYLKVILTRDFGYLEITYSVNEYELITKLN